MRVKKIIEIFSYLFLILCCVEGWLLFTMFKKREGFFYLISCTVFVYILGKLSSYDDDLEEWAEWQDDKILFKTEVPKSTFFSRCKCVDIQEIMKIILKEENHFSVLKIVTRKGTFYTDNIAESLVEEFVKKGFFSMKDYETAQKNISNNQSILYKK